MKRNSIVIIVICVLFGCTVSPNTHINSTKDSGDTLTKAQTVVDEEPIDTIKKRLLATGDYEYYAKLKIACSLYHDEMILPYAILMANKHKCGEACLDVFYTLWELYSSQDSLDGETRKLALHYLHKASSLGDDNAKILLKKIKAKDTSNILKK